MNQKDADAYARVVASFERRTGLPGVRHEKRERFGGGVVVFQLAEPTDRYFRILNEILETEGDDQITATIEKSRPTDIIASPEGQLLQQTISATLNVNRYTFQEDFFAHYAASVFGAEAKIVTPANHIVFGRRGAGKSSLLLYAMHRGEQHSRKSAWIDMEAFSHRADSGVLLEILIDIISQLASTEGKGQALISRLDEARVRDAGNEQQISAFLQTALPDVRRLLGDIATASGGVGVTIFLDDFHVIASEYQPQLLSALYSVSRGNRVFLKISAIETLTRTWDSRTRSGLQLGQDVEELRLDLNLTVPDKALAHIKRILDQLARYCALPDINVLATGADAFSRLVWESAGVPRDALSIFTAAMSGAALQGSKKVSVNAINLAASSTVEPKLRELKQDASEARSRLEALFQKIRDFCVASEPQHRHNAFLVEIKSEAQLYQDVLKLVDLRLLHVIHEGVNLGRAGHRFLALILDYGFYVGNRAAKSVKLFNKDVEAIKYKELRRLRVFRLNEQALQE